MEEASTPRASDDQLQLSQASLLETKRQLESAHARIVELEAKLEEATLWAERAIEDVVDRDQRIRLHAAQLATLKAESEQHERELDEQLQVANNQLAAVHQTRAWRAMTLY